MRVSYPWSVKNEETNKYEPTTEKGDILKWVVIPDQDTYNNTIFHNLYAIILTDDGYFRTIRIENLKYIP